MRLNRSLRHHRWNRNCWSPLWDSLQISPAMQLQFGNSTNSHESWVDSSNCTTILRVLFFLGESSAAGSPSVLRLLSITLHTASHATCDFGKWILAQSSASTSSGLGEVHGKLEWTCFRRCVYDYQIDCVFEKNILNTWKLKKMMSLKYVRGASSGPSWRGSRPEFEGSCGWHFFQERSEIVRILCISSDFSCFASACSCFANSIERCTPSWPSQASPSSSSERSRRREYIASITSVFAVNLHSKAKAMHFINPEKDVKPLGAMN